MSKALLFLFALALHCGLCAQPSGIQTEYNNQPYFQQEVNYKISVKLDDQLHFLRGQLVFEYLNNSPDTLKFIWMHLWPNAYKNNETAFAKQQLKSGSVAFQIAPEEDRGFIDSLQFKADNKLLNFEFHPNHIDIGKIFLNEPLLPGQTVRIESPFRVKIPSSKFSRLGHIGQQYQLCQWYPKPAVYDKYGWHPMPYLNSGEFYSEFGKFEVAITVPSNYVIASSGLPDPNQEEDNFVEFVKSETQKLLKEGFPKEDTFPKTSGSYKTVTYRLEKTHDFAWFADKRYHILESSVKLASGKEVKTYSYFSNINAKDWARSAEFVNDAVKHYSELVGEYPYPVCKSVDGALSAGAGMEYPTITVISAGGGEKSLDNVTAHEVGHNWFYGILASNERDHAWMDEGMNSYYESRYMEKKYGKSSLLSGLSDNPLGKIFHLSELREEDVNTIPYLLQARRNLDQALNLSSDDYTNGNYGIMVYQKTNYMMQYLEAWLGTRKFDAMMQAYYQKWKFKHPYPEDFRQHVKEFTGEELAWFFDDLLCTRKRVDYAIKRISTKENQQFVEVKNTGEIASPISISGIKGDTATTFWFDGFTGKQRLSFPTSGFDSYRINYSGKMLDTDSRNDIIKSRGLFKKGRKPAVGIITGLENPYKAQLFALPTLGYNYYNEFMAGLAIHNIGILRKKFEFVANPMYSFGRSSLAGSVQANYFILPTGSFFNNIDISASAEQYATRFTNSVQRFTGGIKISFVNLKHANKKESYLSFRHVMVRQDFFLSDPFGNDLRRDDNFNVFRYRLADNRIKNPYSVDVDLQHGMRFAKASLTGAYKFSYNNPKKGLRVRFFAGAFLWKSDLFASSPQDVRFRLSGQNGSQDYMFNEIFLGRNENEGLLSQQMSLSDGGFKVFSFRGQTADYLATLNLSTTLPGNLPFRVFLDLGHYENEENDADPLNYSGGISVHFIDGIFEIYAPCINSKAIKNTLSVNNVGFGEQIRFVINIPLMNPLSFLRNLNI
jgi:hypothetical protein